MFLPGDEMSSGQQSINRHGVFSGEVLVAALIMDSLVRLHQLRSR